MSMDTQETKGDESTSTVSRSATLSTHSEQTSPSIIGVPKEQDPGELQLQQTGPEHAFPEHGSASQASIQSHNGPRPTFLQHGNTHIHDARQPGQTESLSQPDLDMPSITVATDAASEPVPTASTTATSAAATADEMNGETSISAARAPSQETGHHAAAQEMNDVEGSSEQNPDEANLPRLAPYRPGSNVFTPFTYFNGVEMFPDLTTSEQEEMALEVTTQAQNFIVADTSDDLTGEDNESDGGYNSDGFSSGSTSAESSVRDYMFENGRRYHRFREGSYNFPNDDVEQEREDMKHAMVKLVCGQKLFFAPINNHAQRILDLGTGTGIWAIEMGDQYPSADILGIDLSPIQPDWLPPNVRFMVDDMESPWLHPRDHFDFIHSRNTVMAIKDWPRLLRRSLEHLKPGGWIELQEIHHRPKSAVDVKVENHPVAKFWTLVTEGLAALGVDLDISSGHTLGNMMSDAGLVNITEREFHIPIGTWPKNKVLKTVGLYWRTILLDGLQAIALGPLMRGLRWNREQVELFLMEVRRAYTDTNPHMYMPLRVVYAQKATTLY